MQISHGTKGNLPRIGVNGVRVPGALHSKVNQVDCSDVVDGFVEHSYYLEEKAAVDDMESVLRGQQPDATKNRRFRADKSTFLITRSTNANQCYLSRP